MRKALFFCNPDDFEGVYPPEEQLILRNLVDLYDRRLDRENWREHQDALAEAEIIISTWGGPHLDEEFLQATPRLKIIFYGAGSIKTIMTEEAWNRGVRITSAVTANAIPVAEFTLAQIILSLKSGWRFIGDYTASNSHIRNLIPLPGGYEASVGILSLGMIGRKVCQLLEPFDYHVSAYDPVADQEVFAELNVERSTIEKIFSECDVVSVHTPLLPETRGSITGALISSMKPGASFINTARGELVHEEELVEVMKKRPDLTAILDVTSQEPLSPDSDLWNLPNVVLTPHIAGAMGSELRRMGRLMIDELRRYLDGKALHNEIKSDGAQFLA